MQKPAILPLYKMIPGIINCCRGLRFMIKNFLTFLLFVSASLAHLDGGKDIPVGGYIADFGYSPQNISAGQGAILAFNLANATTGEAMLPHSVWIRISKGNSVLLAGTFAPQSGNVALTYVFPEGGIYDLKARYAGTESTLAEANFIVSVKEPVNGLLPGFLLITTICIVVYGIFHARKARQKQTY